MSASRSDWLGVGWRIEAGSRVRALFFPLLFLWHAAERPRLVLD